MLTRRAVVTRWSNLHVCGYCKVFERAHATRARHTRTPHARYSNPLYSLSAAPSGQPEAGWAAVDPSIRIARRRNARAHDAHICDTHARFTHTRARDAHTHTFKHPPSATSQSHHHHHQDHNHITITIKDHRTHPAEVGGRAGEGRARGILGMRIRGCLLV